MTTREDFLELQRHYGQVPEFMQKYLHLKILERLKDVGMLCGMDYASHNYKYFEYYVSRYDHSFGTAMTVWNLTHNEKYTLAALFHDISTPVFSHVIDFMNGDYVEQESTEEMTEVVLKSSSLLKDYLSLDGLNIGDIACFKDYSIVDLPRPKMCADRLNNVLTVGMGWIDSIPLGDAKYLIDNIHAENNEDGELELAFNNKAACEIYINLNNKVNERLALPEDDYLMDLLVRIVRRCVVNNYVSYEQLFFITEHKMFEIIENYCKYDKILEEMYHTFKTIKEIPIVNTGVDQKLRLVNPLVNERRYY